MAINSNAIDKIEALKASRQKYLQLGCEIDKLPDSALRRDMQHTHSKLGIFLADILNEHGWSK